MRKIALWGMVAAAAFSTPVRAADLAMKAAPVPAPVATWTGCYIGLNGGASRVSQNVSQTSFAFGGGPSSVVFPLGTAAGSDFTYGGQAGCDYQIDGNWVVGLRGMWDGMHVLGSTSAPGNSAAGPGYGATNTLSFAAQYVDSAVVRVGYLLAPQLMIYGLGGVASANDKYTTVNALPSASTGPSVSQTRTGYDVGAGASWMLTRGFDFFVEYNYINVGNGNVGLMYTSGTASPGSTTMRTSQTVQTVLVGLDFRFTSWIH